MEQPIFCIRWKYYISSLSSIDYDGGTWNEISSPICIIKCIAVIQFKENISIYEYFDQV